MSSLKKAAISGMRFQIEGNPDFLYKLISGLDDTYHLMIDNLKLDDLFVGTVVFTYKHMVIDTMFRGLVWKKEVRLKDLNFIP